MAKAASNGSRNGNVNQLDFSSVFINDSVRDNEQLITHEHHDSNLVQVNYVDHDPCDNHITHTHFGPPQQVLSNNCMKFLHDSAKRYDGTHTDEQVNAPVPNLRKTGFVRDTNSGPTHKDNDDDPLDDDKAASKSRIQATQTNDAAHHYPRTLTGSVYLSEDTIDEQSYPLPSTHADDHKAQHMPKMPKKEFQRSTQECP